jgi:hypothetical protein
MPDVNLFCALPESEYVIKIQVEDNDEFVCDDIRIKVAGRLGPRWQRVDVLLYLPDGTLLTDEILFGHGSLRQVIATFGLSRNNPLTIEFSNGSSDSSASSDSCADEMELEGSITAAADSWNTLGSALGELREHCLDGREVSVSDQSFR